jgi:hypothetical protein
MVIVQFLAGANGRTKCMVSGDGIVKADPSLRSGFRLAARTPPEQLKMYYFAIDFDARMPYHLAPPQGWEAQV